MQVPMAFPSRRKSHHEDEKAVLYTTEQSWDSQVAHVGSYT